MAESRDWTVLATAISATQHSDEEHVAAWYELEDALRNHVENCNDNDKIQAAIHTLADAGLSALISTALDESALATCQLIRSFRYLRSKISVEFNCHSVRAIELLRSPDARVTSQAAKLFVTVLVEGASDWIDALVGDADAIIIVWSNIDDNDRIQLLDSFCQSYYRIESYPMFARLLNHIAPTLASRGLSDDLIGKTCKSVEKIISQPLKWDIGLLNTAGIHAVLQDLIVLISLVAKTVIKPFETDKCYPEVVLQSQVVKELITIAKDRSIDYNEVLMAEAIAKCVVRARSFPDLLAELLNFGAINAIVSSNR
eukprot:jgi/Hompol1/2303/HPOL_000590-RA